ncbi:reverse transcriptase domain-containing protein [Tanacetum coccineum]
MGHGHGHSSKPRPEIAKYMALCSGMRCRIPVISALSWAEIQGNPTGSEAYKKRITFIDSEKANRSLGEGIKARLGAKNKNWSEELSYVLWEYRTMIKSNNGDTPFSLTYGMEAVIPAEIRMPTLRTGEVDLVQNNEALEINLDLLEEKREQASIREAKSKEKMEKYYNSKVQSTSFKPRDLVYRNKDASRAEDTRKPGHKWEGPYEVTEALEKGAYKLRDRDGKQLLRTWNVNNLKKCYIHKMLRFGSQSVAFCSKIVAFCLKLRFASNCDLPQVEFCLKLRFASRLCVLPLRFEFLRFVSTCCGLSQSVAVWLRFALAFCLLQVNLHFFK